MTPREPQALVVSRTVSRWPRSGRNQENKVSEVGVVVRGTCRGHHKSRDMPRKVKGRSFSACSEC